MSVLVVLKQKFMVFGLYFAYYMNYEGNVNGDKTGVFKIFLLKCALIRPIYLAQIFIPDIAS